MDDQLSLPFSEAHIYWRAYRPAHDPEPVLVASVVFENHKFIKGIQRVYRGPNARADAEAFVEHCRKTDGSKVNLIQKKGEL